MALLVNLRHLEEDSGQETGELTGEELGITGLDELIQAPLPLQYDLEVSLQEDALLALGSLEITLKCECSRCLKPFDFTIREEGWACHLPLTGEDAVVVDNDCVDLTPHIREHMLLELPQRPVCGDDCKGWKKPAEKSSQQPAEATEEKPSPWAALDKLKLD
jgi:uncharacterized protein